MTPTTAASPLLRFDQYDVDRAYKEWGCNCGPAALAACLGWTLDAVRPHLGDFERRGYMGPTTTEEAIRQCGFRCERVPLLPTHGIVRVQWHGPWMRPGVPPRVAYNFTHLVTSKRHAGEPWIFDVNGGWLPMVRWEAEIIPLLTAAVKRADGGWSFTHRWEVRKHL